MGKHRPEIATYYRHVCRATMLNVEAAEIVVIKISHVNKYRRAYQ